jgi:exosortase/archaeosortase family protein
VLDGVGVIHFRQGVILQTENTQFLTEEACSGIRSLFSSWFVVAAYGVAMRHRWWRVLINLLQTVLWVMLGNVLRIVLVVSLADSAPWLASGWGHELLGLGVFAFILAMVASTDAGLSELISSELVIEPRDTSATELDGFGETFRPPPITLPPFPLRGVLLVGACVILLLTVFVSARAHWVRSQLIASPMPAAFVPPTPDQESDLPESIAGFGRSTFRHLSRGPNYLWAPDSYTWQYTHGPLVATVSIDSPWKQWHNLNYCYRNIGWQTEAEFSILPAEQSWREAMPGYRHSELLMQRSGQHGFVVFSAIDRDGLPVPEGLEAPQVLADPERFLAHARAVLGMGGERDELMTPDRLPVSTVQLYAESLSPWTADDLQKLRELFFEARSVVVELRQQASEPRHP